MRVRYRARRDALVAAVEEELPEATIRGIAAGLHATVELPAGADERAIQAEAARRRVLIAVMSDARIGEAPLPAGAAARLRPYARARRSPPASARSPPRCAACDS